MPIRIVRTRKALFIYGQQGSVWPCRRWIGESHWLARGGGVEGVRLLISPDEPSAAPADMERLFREHGPFVWRSLRRLGLSESDADDLCQEVFVVVFRKLPHFEKKSSLRTWLYGIALRVALAHRRSARTRHELPTEVLPDIPTHEDPHHRLAEHEARRQLDRALDTLDEKKRAVFVLYEIERLSMNEVAEVLACPVQTAYSRLHAAREQVESFFRQTAKGALE